MQETTYSRWLISDMYYPSESIEGPIKSHEAICVLNTNDQDAGLTITLYFEDREPMQLAPQRCRPAGMSTSAWMRPEPRTAPVYRWIRRMPAVVESTQPVAVQYSRADARQRALGIMTTIAQPMG